MKRIHVVISGIVQGVAFRAYARRTAQALNLTGWVRNLHDGRVEAVIEGDSPHVASMLAWCRKGPATAVVKDVEVKDEPYSGEFRDFQIVY